MRSLIISLSLLALPAIAHAQEPSAPIKSGETVTIAASHPLMNVVATGDPAKAAPVIYPEPRPMLKKPLGTVARELRVQHAEVPKAKTVANDEQPITEEK